MQILTVAEFVSIVSQWDVEKPPFVDFETNAKQPYEHGARIVCVSMTATNKHTQELETIQIPLTHEEGINAEPLIIQSLAEFFRAWAIGAFWIQAETPWCLACLKTRPNFVSDPYICLRMMQDHQGTNLKDAVEKYLAVRMAHIEDVLPQGTYDFGKVHAQDPKGIAYSEADSYEGARLAQVVEAKIQKMGMLAVYQLEIKAAATMAEMSLAGYEIDLDVLKWELDNEDRKLSELEQDIFQRFGCEPFKLNSGPKLGAAFAKIGVFAGAKTDKGADSWAKPVLESMVLSNYSLTKDQVDIINLILEWKSRFSVRNTLRKSPARVSMDGKIHPTWKTIGHDGTARMYAEDPSITSLPLGCRRACKAPKGKRWMKWDWMQAEIRALAAASQDKALIAFLNSGVDFHSSVYAKMKGIDISEVSKDDREVSKIISFSILYSGGSPFHVARALGVSMEIGTKMVKEYFDMFPTLREFLDNLRASAVRTRHCRTFMNRVRRLDGDDTEKIMNMACDAMGQQSIGTALKIAIQKMVDYSHHNHPAMKGLCQLIPVFDAVFYCIDSDVPVRRHVEVCSDLVQLNMAGVILRAEFEMGPSWGDVKKYDEEYLDLEANLGDGQEAIERHLAKSVPRETLPENQIPIHDQCMSCSGHGYNSREDTCSRCKGSGKEPSLQSGLDLMTRIERGEFKA